MEYIAKKEIDFKNPLVIEGFPGVGLVGSIAAYQIIKKLELECIGYFDVPEAPPVNLVEEGVVYPPIRVYGREDLIVLFSDVIIPPVIVHKLSDKIVEILTPINPQIVVSLGGLATGKSEKVYGIASSKELLEIFEKYDIPILKFGMVGGVSGSLIVKSNNNKIPAIGLLAETVGIRPDPRGASNLVNVLNKMYGLNVNVEELIEEADKIDEKIKQLAQEHAKLMTKTARSEYPMYL
ncbi:proteasome assembly chaperone family protein [Methanotorris igneus]|uniref:3-isopropylmalate dehydratase n=1 Tax=Methanotorris igneus (strain DSM 5666 / JCM 11834 / Kol 5) TaxID=880724 RepID=F6BD13_METIK|nr:proteasome assembly chaperone family protein [Methanotorris igneus]AEF96374.1 Conserved hypothetical protein CHP00061 [Methanotorris igneus Kol 5]